MAEGMEDDSLVKEQQRLKDCAPSPMNTMLQKQCASEAITKRLERQQMKTYFVAGTSEGTPTPMKQKRPPHCSSCQ